ncbi:hypothetical protein BJP39_19430 [Streptomyces sp. CC77]|nr:hypothetical protein BJP39_19430 [Streptomyces sp. CC77]
MHRLTVRAARGAAALGAAALLASCTGGAPSTPAPSEGRRTAPASPAPEKPARPASPAPSADPATPSAHLTGDTAALPLVAGAWGDGEGKTPPERLTWPPTARAADGSAPVRVTVKAPSPPSYASFMLHSRIDASGIPDEDTRRQRVLACGTGIADPGCRITDNNDGSYTVEVPGSPPEGHPYRVLYVQWAPDRPGAEETWASWQLPTG